jgi:hypothetical protein
LDSLRLIGGLAYEKLTIPENHRFAPLSSEAESRHHLLPKAGLIWTPRDHTTFRAGYSESVGGVSFDQSFQLEPTQVAGFNQAFRSLIPESVAAANSAAEFTSYGFSVEHRLPSHTYITLNGEWLQSEVNRKVGAFDIVDFLATGFTNFHERLTFDEASLALSVHQLLGTEWALGAVYQVSRATLKDNFVDVSDQVATDSGFPARTRIESTLHSLNAHVIYQNTCGFFTRLNATWLHQQNEDYQPARADEDVWHLDAMTGYRFPRRHMEVSAGVLNITDQDYRLSPLNLHSERWRERTFVVQLKVQF